MASPANRRRAREAGIDLATVAGSGPGGRIVRGDLERTAPAAAAVRRHRARPAEVTEIKVIGMRRVIAERMSEAARSIPHFCLRRGSRHLRARRVREHLNARRARRAVPLSYLPFMVGGADAGAQALSAMQRPLRRRARRAVATQRRAHGHRHPDQRGPEGAGGAQRAISSGSACSRGRDRARGARRAIAPRAARN